MNLAFVCTVGDADDEQHTTTIAMVRCSRCGKYGVGGYACDTCGHADVDEPDELAGHGPGKCSIAADTAAGA